MQHSDQYQASLSWPHGSERPEYPQPLSASAELHGGYFYMAFKFEDGSVYCNTLGHPYLSRPAAERAAARYMEGGL